MDIVFIVGNFLCLLGGIIILVASRVRGHVLRPGSGRQSIFHKGWSLYVFYGLFGSDTLSNHRNPQPTSCVHHVNLTVFRYVRSLSVFVWSGVIQLKKQQKIYNSVTYLGRNCRIRTFKLEILGCSWGQRSTVWTNIAWSLL